MFTIGLQSDIDCAKIAKKVLEEEPKIIKEFPPLQGDGSIGDAGTGLGDKSLTARFYWYNVLDWPEAECIKDWIYKGYEKFSGGKADKLFVKCWANVMRKGEQVLPHTHSPYMIDPQELMSGNLTIQTDGSTTTNYSNYGRIPECIRNVEGVMHFFNSGTEHWTSRYEGEGERITIAFDLMSEPYYEEFAVPEVRDKIVVINGSRE
tara:strand:- start:61 stop:678 length:618 start_codon:yes stop_codon:yes gene_type:complete